MTGAVKKPTIKSLSEENKKLKGDMKDYIELKTKVSNLEAKLKALEDGKNPREENKGPNESKCKKCKKIFNSMNGLKKHIKEEHPQKVECKVCSESFAKNCELEVHLESQHKDQQKFPCTKCDKVFFLYWRLKKHESIHSSVVGTNCHYFNNNKRCPFEKLGCMFKHNESELCKYDKFCSKSLCSFKHSEVTKNRDTQESIEKDENEKESIENGIGIGHRDSVRTFDCESCDFKSESYNIYFEHINLAHEYGDDFEVKLKSF